MCSLPTIDAEHDAAFNSAFVGPTTFAIFFGKGMGDGGTLFIHRSMTEASCRRMLKSALQLEPARRSAPEQI
jgi:hypothetical protein